MIRISVCMIVKEEEKVLARCLDSLNGIYDELIVVDTGSADGTKAIAQKYTSHVYDFAWCNDFSAARNFACSKATCEYIYTADADEVLDEENRLRFMQLKQALLPEVEVVEMAYANQLSNSNTSNFDVEFRPKLFRRLRPFQFCDPIHEVLRTDPIVYRSNVTIRHCAEGDHSGRDLAIFAEMVAQGKVFSSRLEMMYARELMLAGQLPDFRAAKPYFEHVRSDPSKASEVLRRAACVLSWYAALERDGEKLLRYAAPELVGQPPAEICCALGNYYLTQDDEQQAADWYAAALSGAQPELIASAVGNVPLYGLSECFKRAGDEDRAQYYREQAENWNPEQLNPDRQEG